MPEPPTRHREDRASSGQADGWRGWRTLALAASILSLIGMLAPAPAAPQPTPASGKAPQATRAPTDEAQEPAQGIRYEVTIHVTEQDGGLEKTLKSVSNLVELKDEPPPTPGGLVRRAMDDRARFIAALYTKAHYGGTVDIRLAGTPISADNVEAAVTAAALAGPVPITVTVTPGPLFRFNEARVLLAPDGRPATRPDLAADRLGLGRGEPAESGRILEAEAKIVGALRADGRATAGITDRQVVADHATRTVDVTIVAAPGPVAVFGAISIIGSKRVEHDFLARRIDIRPGERYDPERLARLRRDLLDLGVFSSVRVVEAESLGPGNALPVTIEVEDRKPRFVGVSAEYDTTEGLALNAYWGHRNLFGRAERLRIDATVSRLLESDIEALQYRLGATFTKPGILTPHDDLVVEVAALRETPDAYIRTGGIGTISLVRKLSEQLSVRGGLSVDGGRIEDALGAGSYFIVSTPLAVTWDSSNDRFNPTEGFRATAGIEPAWSQEGPLVFGNAEVAAYHALDEEGRFVLAGRIKLASAVGLPVEDIPAHRRYYAGGGGSVRGYPFQSLSPRLPSGDLIGGRSLFEASLEARLRVSERIGIVPFIDAGTASTALFPDFSDIRFGAGIGLRYYTSIGPIRVDVAFPLNPIEGERGWALYLGLGQAF